MEIPILLLIVVLTSVGPALMARVPLLGPLLVKCIMAPGRRCCCCCGRRCRKAPCAEIDLAPHREASIEYGVSEGPQIANLDEGEQARVWGATAGEGEAQRQDSSVNSDDNKSTHDHKDIEGGVRFTLRWCS